MREPIDGWDDLSCHRDFDHCSRRAEDILHIDNNQRSLFRIDRLEGVESTATEENALEDLTGKLCRVHQALL